MKDKIKKIQKTVKGLYKTSIRRFGKFKVYTAIGASGLLVVLCMSSQMIKEHKSEHASFYKYVDISTSSREREPWETATGLETASTIKETANNTDAVAANATMAPESSEPNVPTTEIPEEEETTTDESVETTTDDSDLLYPPEWWSDTKMSYEDYGMISDPSSDQYKLQNWYGYTDYTTGIRMVNGRYCIAIGSYYSTSIGQYIDVVLENGAYIPCIVADCKADYDTLNGAGQIGANNGMIEFVVDSSALPAMVSQMGSCEYEFDCQWQSRVSYIKTLNYGTYIN